MKLDGRVAMITGAGSGLGREIALAFAREGARIAANDIRADTATALCREIERAGGEAIALVADVSDSVEVAAMFEELAGKWARLDILVNNAGIAVLTDEVKANAASAVADLANGKRPTKTLGAARQMTDAQWRRTISVHLDGTFYCTREALKLMEPQASGRIINMASVLGLTGFAAAPDYSAAKAGIIGLTKAVAREAAACGICVNAIAPGFVDTPLLDVLDETARQLVIAQTPVGRLGTPAEVAAVALYLASDDAAFTVGQIISPNGGYLI